MQSIFLGHPDKKDVKRFESNKIYPKSNIFQFEELPANLSIRVNDWTSDLPEFKPLEELCAGHKVREILIIKNDTVLFNYKKNDERSRELHSSYSMSKSVISCLIGMAIDDGFMEGELSLIHI